MELKSFMKLDFCLRIVHVSTWNIVVKPIFDIVSMRSTDLPFQLYGPFTLLPMVIFPIFK